MQDSSGHSTRSPGYSSYSKRHASFSSPREVPLPSPNNLNHESVNPFASYFSKTASPQSSASSSAQDVGASVDSSVSPKEGQRATNFSPPQSPHPQRDDSSRKPRPPFSRQNSLMKANFAESSSNEPTRENRSVRPENSFSTTASNSMAILPARPFSLPEPESQSYSTFLRHSQSTTPANSELLSDPSRWTDRYSSASLPLPSQVPFHLLPRTTTTPNPVATESQVVSSTCGMNSTSSSSMEVALPGSAPGDRAGLFSPPYEASSSGSSTGSSSSLESRESAATSNSSYEANKSPTTSDRTISSPVPPLSPITAAATTATSENRAPSRPQRPISPFRAPQPPPYQPPRNPASDSYTAMRRYMTPSQSVSTSFPPPEPPVVLPPEPTDDMSQLASQSRAAYIPFLSHAPPPPDSWIEVETTQSEYKLHIRLPGFSREGITLATKRRRILHVVADSWENGGGHFERRISFGYDADLVQVRAEFDGTMLRIVIPRRASPVIWNSFRPGPFGRA